MSEPTAAAVVPTGAPIDPKKVEALLADVFKLMEYPAKLDFKDMSDGSLGVAVHFDGELPGITPGKRSYLVDSVQFWLNKVVNRPNTPRRWVNLGVNAFPEPRSQQQQQQQQPVEAKPAAVPAEAKPVKTPGKGAPKADVKTEKPANKPQEKREERPRRDGQVDERTLKPAPDAAMSAAGKLLAEKSAKLGRVYAVMALSADQRALMLQTADAVKGQKTKAEGEGHWRRVTFTPDKPTVIPKKQVMPDYDDEGDEDE